MFGRRSDGKELKHISPIFRLMPSLMKERDDSQVFFNQDIVIEKIEEYTNKKAEEGIKMQEMYNNSLSANNKIINYNDLVDIFNAMNEEITKWMKIYESEERNNQRIDYKYQKWTFKDSSSSYKMSINFEDDTDKAPNIRIILYRDDDKNRTVRGEVWEDERTQEVAAANIADGIKQVSS